VAVMLLGDEDDAPAGAIATVSDLSEQKRQAKERTRLQRKLLRSERLAALGEMAARIAHEVRNPLAAIGAAALSIEEDDAGDATTRAQARAIGDEVRRLDSILTELLRFARPAPAQHKLVDLRALVEEAASMMRADPSAKGVEVVVVEGEAGRCRVSADPNGLRQVMLNVLRNAVEACASSGRVVCAVSVKDGVARVEISDTGSGLTRTASRRAFEPFYSTKSRGTGLGLPISRQIVEEHGGELKLVTGRDGGTTVSVQLKVSDERP